VEVVPLQRDDVVTRHDYYQPVYRVDFWRRQDPSPGIGPDSTGYEQDSYRIHGAKNVHEVRAWADENAGHRQFVIWIELGPDDDRSIARVEGVDPTQRHLAE
jgi:hypothetical protein